MSGTSSINGKAVGMDVEVVGSSPTCGPFYWHGLTLIPAWINNYIHYKMCDEIAYPFLNFNGATIEV